MIMGKYLKEHIRKLLFTKNEVKYYYNCIECIDSTRATAVKRFGY